MSREIFKWQLVSKEYIEGGVHVSTYTSDWLSSEDMTENLRALLHEGGHHCCGDDFDPAEWDEKMQNV